MAETAYLVTAVAYYVIGIVMIYVATRVLLAHPVNRVFIFGEYFTAEGVRAVIQHWPLVSLFGLFIFACGVEHHLHWLVNHGRPNLLILLEFMGWIEAGISVITAVAVVVVTVRRGMYKWRRN